MICIQNHHTDPYFNLAAEEYLLKNFTADCFMLWRNEPSIIVGKHQNTLAEVNLGYVLANNIKIVRRLSGGGTVFHDPGNLNFTFIREGEEGKLVDFRKFTTPILEVLHHLGVNAVFEGRNNLTINGLKFSGNAEHVYKNRTLHHGTLLFSSVLSDLSQALQVNPTKYTDKAVKSVRSEVTNISGHLKHPMKVEEFSELIMRHIRENHGGDQIYSFTEEDSKAIGRLRDEKYSCWEWNFGYSPKYDFRRELAANNQRTGIHIRAEKGVIREISITGDLLHDRAGEEIAQALLGVRHDPEAISRRLSEWMLNDHFTGLTKKEFIAGMF